MEKKVNVFEKHKYMFLFTAVILLSQFIGNFEKVHEPFTAIMSYHVVDFKIGWVSRVLPGEIFQWFFSKPTIQNITYYELALFGVVALCSGYFLEQLYFSVKGNNKQIYLYLIVLFCVSGSTFNMYYRQLGMLDVYWVYAFILFLAFLQNKKTWFLIPLSFLFMIAVHFAAFLCYIPLMSTIILYKASIAAEKSEKRHLVIIFAVSVVIAVGAFAFFHYNEAHNLKMTYEELDNYLSMKGSENNQYYSYAFFKKFSMELPEEVMHFDYKDLIKSGFLPDFLKKPINEIAWQIQMNFSLLKNIPSIKKDAAKMIIVLILSGAPVMVYIYSIYCRMFTATKDKLKRFVCICAMALFPFTFLCSVIFSYDYARWYSHAFSCCYIFFFVVLKSEGDKLLPKRDDTTCKTKKLACLLYMVLLFLIRFDPYRVIGT